MKQLNSDQSWRCLLVGVVLALVCLLSPRWLAAQSAPDWRQLEAAFERDARPLLAKLCHQCHAGDRTEAEIDFAAFATLADVRKHTGVWQKVHEMLASRQMPPRKAEQPTESERLQLETWVQAYLTTEAQAHAGDPGPVVLRRLNNAEYTYTLRDLTGLEALDPAREFPVDGAAGEGFTNTGNALAMSPGLVAKYLEAAKKVSSHLVLLPDGVKFSPHTTRRDWTNELLARIRKLYRERSSDSGAERVNLQGIVFDTNHGGRLPLERYLAVTLAERDALSSSAKTTAQVASDSGLSPKYLGLLWTTLTSAPEGAPSLLLDGLRSRWRAAKVEDAPALAAEVASWQQALWKFSPVGHIGRQGGPTAWLEPVDPIVSRQELRVKLPPAADGPASAALKEIVIHLSAGDGGDGNDGDYVVWERPRLVLPGRPEILLRDVRAVARELVARRQRLFASAAQCLGAAAEASTATDGVDVKALSQRRGVDEETLAAWLDHLGIGTGGTVDLGTPISRRTESASGYDFIKGWVGDDALSVVANSSDQHVRIPGNMKPHSVAVHPAPTRAAVVAWRSLAAATLNISGVVQHAHPECGNGVVWSLELRRGKTRQRLAAGISHGAKEVPIGPLEAIAVLPGDMIALVIGPRDGNHSCDLTAIDVVLRDGTHEWNLARDVAPDILAGNPHGDSHGNPDVWHFYSEPASGPSGPVIPAGSLLARWQSAASVDEKQKLADELQGLLLAGAPAAGSDAAGAPDAALYKQLSSFGGPLLSAALRAVATPAAGAVVDPGDSPFGLDPARFGKHPGGAELDAASLCVRAPTVLEVRLPADLVEQAEFVTAGTLHAATGQEGSVQLQVLLARSEPAGASPAASMVVLDDSEARHRVRTAFEAFRQLFPPALCYTQIVPVDEVVTLTLYHREDEHLKRLMLDEEQGAQLDRLWSELEYVSQGALELVTAFEQIAEFATQDRPDMVVAFRPMRQPINDRAALFRQRLLDSEPKHLEALLDFAARAYRRPLAATEPAELRALYAHLREQELPHDEAIRLVLARILIAPAFLYRLEKPVPGPAQGSVNQWELASRLSYFLWSSLPDAELGRLAAAGRLNEPENLVAQTRRLLADARTRRLATEFGCQWLHIYDFDELDEKSERHFPTFAALRGAMYEESIRTFTDFFQADRSPLSLLDADHTFLNEELAKHYGIPGVTGPEWRRVDGVKKHARGGILTLASTLSKQSGASRTSPILRGNWLSEVVLGEKLPRPPKDVPQLPQLAPAGLTERQLIEKHSSDPACRNCHVRIDPFGFALENYDAIGRHRQKDAAELAIDSRTTLPDGTGIDGLDGLRDYLLSARREAFLKQFSRKLLGYALGRAVQLSDEPLLASMRAVAMSPDAGVGAMIERIVLSRQFREIRGVEAPADE